VTTAAPLGSEQRCAFRTRAARFSTSWRASRPFFAPERAQTNPRTAMAKVTRFSVTWTPTVQKPFYVASWQVRV
jgi:hypothetical protein